jgi:hypothetical protein
VPNTTKNQENYDMRRTTILALSLALLVGTLPTLADVYFRSETRFDQSQGKAPGNVAVEGWVKGDQGKFLFEESGGNPMMPQGSYLLTKDGGQTFELVNPQEKTWASWDIEAMLRFAGEVMNGMGPLLKMEIQEPQVEILADEAGEAILGLPTRHYKIRTTYRMKMRVIGIKQSSDTETVQDLWTTTAIDEEAFGAWLRKEPPKTGNEELDRLITSEVGRTEGFVLRTIAESRSVGGKKKRREQTTTTTTEVTEIDTKASIADSTFTFPKDEYQRVEMMPVGGEEEGGNPFKGLFKGEGR